ncbi:MAG: DNA repair protein RadA, partial [bacterium]|nr:DNA repair protein RadA [bacterium]
MAMTDKIKTVYICSQCGFESPRWAGKCPQCNEWNTMNEEIKKTAKTVSHNSATASKSISVTPLSAVDTDSEFRFVTTISELDRVLGGGIV